MIADCQKLSPCCADFDQQLLASLINTAMVRRAGAVALILGSALTLVNQTDAIIGEDRLQILPLVIAYVTPFVVATVSQVLGVRRAVLDLCQRRPVNFSQDTLLHTAISHGIPLRTLFLALIIGAANAVIIVGAAVSGGGEISAVPAAHIGQGFFLPMLFGLMSQAVSYRRITCGFTPRPTRKGKPDDDIV